MGLVSPQRPWGLSLSVRIYKPTSRDSTRPAGPACQLNGWLPLSGFSVPSCALDPLRTVTCYGPLSFLKKKFFKKYILSVKSVKANRGSKAPRLVSDRAASAMAFLL